MIAESLRRTCEATPRVYVGACSVGDHGGTTRGCGERTPARVLLAFSHGTVITRLARTDTHTHTQGRHLDGGCDCDQTADSSARCPMGLVGVNCPSGRVRSINAAASTAVSVVGSCSQLRASTTPRTSCHGGKTYVAGKSRWHSLRPASSPETLRAARVRARLPQAPASLGQSARWSALAGQTGLGFDMGEDHEGSVAVLADRVELLAVEHHVASRAPVPLLCRAPMLSLLSQLLAF